MIPKLQCSIELLDDPAEESWFLSVRHTDVPALILLINGLFFRKIPKITFVDDKNENTVSLSVTQDKNYVLHLKKHPVSVSKVWLEALLSVLLDVQFGGWREGAHLDAEFALPSGTASVTVSVAYPQ